jgi:arylsulfatase A-like enzyme
MQSFDRDLGTIIQTYRQAGILDRTTFIVTADHGMSAVRERVPFSALDDAIHLAGATKIYEEADTAAAIGIRELNKARAVALNVVRLDGHAVDASFYKVRARGQWMYRVAYMRPDLPYRVRQAYEMLVATDASASGAEVMIDYGPHITTGDRIANGYHWWGGHLGPQWDDQHIPLIIAGAGVRHGVTSSYPARLVDIAPTVERILGLAPTRTDGLVLQDALTTRDPALAGRQSREGRVLIPLVRALAARSLDT